MSIGERYAKAVSSGVDYDVITAAGMMGESVACTLYRLRSEFGQMRGPLDVARRQADEGAAGNQARTQWVIILSRMTTLPAARRALSIWAIERAQVRRVDIDQRDVRHILSRVLDVWLDPACHHCNGRGFTGGAHRGELQTLCRPCRGSGHRRESLGRNDVERGFSANLMMEMDALLAQAERDIRAALNRVQAAKALIADAGQEGAVNR